MSYCTTTELGYATGSDLSSTILQAIIDDGDREIDAYLARYGLTGTASGACKSASLKLATAGVYQRYRAARDHPPIITSGDWSQSDSVDDLGMIKELRDSAFKLLDHYVDVQTSLSASKVVFVRKVSGYP